MQTTSDPWGPHLDRAFHALQQGRMAEAGSLFSELVTTGSRDPQDNFGLAMVRYNQRQWEDCRQALLSACRLESGFVHAWLYLGVVEEQRGRHRSAAGAYLRADRLVSGADPSNLPADVKQLLGRGARYLGEELFAAFAEELAAVARDHSSPAVARIADGVEMFCGRTPVRYAHPRWRPGLFYVPDLQPRPFFERQDFPWVAELESCTSIIREELIAGLSSMQGFEPYVQYAKDSPQAQIWGGLNGSFSWSTLHLARHGQTVVEACARFPRTFTAIKDVPDLHDVRGYGPEIMFSLLHPKTLIPAHRCSVNGRLVAHLPLIVPPNCGYLRAADEKREWVEGQLMVFDDTFDHEAWNGSDERRIVLIFDVWNPQLSLPEREAFRRVLDRSARFERELLAESIFDEEAPL